MASKFKKEVRRKFRESCLLRDCLACVMCGLKAKSIEEAEDIFDVHHITNPKNIINGGFVMENGISLCPNCHVKAEQFHATGTLYPGYSVEDLYKRINSSYEKAVEASKLLSD
jgi:predicted HNH restriction endonuclease